MSTSLGPTYSLFISRPAISLLQIKNAFQRSYPWNFAAFFNKFENVQLKSDILSSVAELRFFCRTESFFAEPRFFCRSEIFLHIQDGGTICSEEQEGSKDAGRWFKTFLVQSCFKILLYVKLFVFGVLVGRCLGTKEGKRMFYFYKWGRGRGKQRKCFV